MNRSVDLNDLVLLSQVVEHGSYTAAASVTGVPKSTISQRIAALEGRIGVGLLRRTSRSFSLTEAGTELLPRAQAIAAIVRQLERCVDERDDHLRGSLRVACSSAIAEISLAGVVTRFLSQHAGVSIRVDAADDSAASLGDVYDVALTERVGTFDPAVLVEHASVELPWGLAAAPAWLAANGTPATPSAVRREWMLSLASPDVAPCLHLTREGQDHVVEPSGKLVLNDLLTLKRAALAGAGIACLPRYLSREARRTGDLVSVLPDWACQATTLSIMTTATAGSFRLAREFASFVALAFPALLQS